MALCYLSVLELQMAWVTSDSSADKFFRLVHSDLRRGYLRRSSRSLNVSFSSWGVQSTSTACIESAGIDPSFCRASFKSAIVLIVGSLCSPSAATRIVTTMYSLWNCVPLDPAITCLRRLLKLTNVSSSNFPRSSNDSWLNCSSVSFCVSFTSHLQRPDVQ